MKHNKDKERSDIMSELSLSEEGINIMINELVNDIKSDMAPFYDILCKLDCKSSNCYFASDKTDMMVERINNGCRCTCLDNIRSGKLKITINRLWNAMLIIFNTK